MRSVVGIDLVEVAEVAEAWRRFGDSYLSRVFTDEEVAACRRGDDIDALGLAQRFAVKEAFVKALPGRGGALGWRAASLDATGGLRLSPAARQRAEQAGLRRWDVAVSGTAGHAAAVVLGRGPVA